MIKIYQIIQQHQVQKTMHQQLYHQQHFILENLSNKMTSTTVTESTTIPTRVTKQIRLEKKRKI